MDDAHAGRKISGHARSHGEEEKRAHKNEEPKPGLQAVQIPAVSEDDSRRDREDDEVEAGDENGVQGADPIVRPERDHGEARKNKQEPGPQIIGQKSPAAPGHSRRFGRTVPRATRPRGAAALREDNLSATPAFRRRRQINCPGLAARPLSGFGASRNRGFLHKTLSLIHPVLQRSACFHVEHFHNVSQVGILNEG
jgi:hypothetical protein